MNAPLLTMSYPRGYLRRRIEGLERPLNLHLVKLLGFDFGRDERDHFRREISDWLEDIGSWRLKPHDQQPSAKLYYNHLFDYPFGGSEIRNVTALMQRIERDYHVKSVVDPSRVADQLQQLHWQLADRLSRNAAFADLLP